VLAVVFSQASALIDVTYALGSDHLIRYVRQAQERSGVTPVPLSTTC
jgi:hypothetical protein